MTEFDRFAKAAPSGYVDRPAESRDGRSKMDQSMRDRISAALKRAVDEDDRRRACTLRLIGAAIKDRDQASRALGKDGMCEDDVRGLLATMIKQREEQASTYENSGRIDLAEEERQEIQVIRKLLPPQLDEGQIRSACAEVVHEIGAQGLRDVGRAMTALKQRYPGQMDFTRASSLVKEMLG